MLHNLRPAGAANPNRRLVFICGEMAELGPQTQALHAELGRAVAEAGVDLLVTVGKLPQTTAQAARETARHDLQTQSFEDTLSVCDRYAGIPPQRRYTIGQGLPDGPVGAGGGGIG